MIAFPLILSLNLNGIIIFETANEHSMKAYWTIEKPRKPGNGQGRCQGGLVYAGPPPPPRYSRGTHAHKWAAFGS